MKAISLFSVIILFAALLTGCGGSGLLLTPSGDYVEASLLPAPQRKVLEKAQDSLYHIRALRALESREFVLEANRLITRRGRTANVTPSTNFVSLHGGTASVQVAPFAGGGPNGVGGITLDGRPSDIRVSTDSKGYTIMTMNVSGAVIAASLTIQLSPGGDNAEVTVSSSFSSQSVTLRGRLIPYESSAAYKGTAY